MDYLQYFLTKYAMDSHLGFKPCYKWITFNTSPDGCLAVKKFVVSFKPCYKWITFNTS